MPTNATAPVALIVEDSRIQARVLEHRLAQAGYLVRVAGNGVIALDLIRDQKPDVIISDIEMPKMNGYDLCRAVKKDPQLSDVPVVLLSTLSEAEDIIKGLDAGADNYVTKPYDPTYLLNRVESLRKTPLHASDEAGVTEMCVTLNGRTYHVKSGRQQVLNLLISTFENAVEKNRELHKLNEQLTLAKEKLTQWNTQLESLNSSLATANDRMSRDLNAAARVQQSLLPDTDLDHSSLRIVWKYTPCAELAGDFLNYFLLDDRYLALFVVDVSGHGAASSLLAVAVGRLLTAHASASSLLARQDPFTGKLTITPPAAVVRELNRRFPMEAQGGLYFTIVYGVLDLESYQLKYVNAGHPAMAHVPHGEAPRFLPGDGFPIGLMEDNEWDEHSLSLQRGDRLFLYSDGVPEAMDAELEQMGDEKMLEIMQAKASGPLADAIAGLHDAVQTWCQPNGPKDDVSILGLERLK
ncbi:MAG: SpoIIE family protein phosphatase [Planctomycetaceae bacterium]